MERESSFEGGSCDDVREVSDVVAVSGRKVDFGSRERRRCAVSGRQDNDVLFRNAGGVGDGLSETVFEPIGDAPYVEGNDGNGFAV